MLAHVVSDEIVRGRVLLETLADLAQEGGHIETKILADVACDKKAIRSRYMAEGIEVARTSGALGWTNASPVSWRNTRSCLHVKGARRASFWKALIGYGRRRKVERTFSDLKRLPETFSGIGRMERMSRVDLEGHRVLNEYGGIRMKSGQSCKGLSNTVFKGRVYRTLRLPLGISGVLAAVFALSWAQHGYQRRILKKASNSA